MHSFIYCFNHEMLHLLGAFYFRTNMLLFEKLKKIAMFWKMNVEVNFYMKIFTLYNTFANILFNSAAILFIFI